MGKIAKKVLCARHCHEDSEVLIAYNLNNDEVRMTCPVSGLVLKPEFLVLFEKEN